jgi:hypothetical protein
VRAPCRDVARAVVLFEGWVALELATPRRRDAPPLLGLSASRGLVERRRLGAHWVDANPPCRWPRNLPKQPRPRLRGSNAVAHPPILTNRRDPSTGFNSPSEFHPRTTADPAASTGEPTGAAMPAPSEVSSPAAFSQPTGATYLRRDPSRRLRCVLRVLALSTPCSPVDLPGLFHPGPALGVHPSRPRSSRAAVRHSWRRVPPGVPAASSFEGAPAPPGIRHDARSPPTTSGV